MGVSTITPNQAGAVTGENSDMSKQVAAKNSSVQTTNSKTTSSTTTVSSVFAQIRLIHPLILAMGQILVVVGVCLLMTDNRELELYFRIEFDPPKTDILN